MGFLKKLFGARKNAAQPVAAVVPSSEHLPDAQTWDYEPASIKSTDFMLSALVRRS
jgi:hypothetical protein